MTKEYITPEMETITILTDTSILAVSVAVIENFTVTDGEW